MNKRIEVHSLDEMEKLAIRLAAFLSPPDVITLEGELGTGKTTFTKALAKALGVRKNVNSPTFTILKQYEGDYLFNHLDVYRLADSDEDLGWDELFYGNAISVIEWAQYIRDVLPIERLDIEIVRQSKEGRLLILKPIGERFEKICEELTK